jgi:hypothetical protein
VDRYELLVAFSSRIDDWGMVTDPDNFDERSHDALVAEYRNKLQVRGVLERMDGKSDEDLLYDYVCWLDDNGGMRTAGPGHNGLSESVDRFLNEQSNGRVKNNA